MENHATNGVSLSTTPRGRATPGREPLARVLDLDGKTATTVAVAGILAIFVHGTAVARTALVSLDLLRWTEDLNARVALRLAETIDVETLKPPEPPPPPPPEPDPPKEVVKAPPPAPKDAPPPPPPAAAQAGRVLTQEPDPNEPVDLTNSFVQGNATTYAGGVTQAGGTSNTAVYNPNARATGVPGGTGAPQAPPAPVVDRSRAAGLSGSSDWKCPWPSEADSEQIDDAYVMVQVTVGPNGRASQVRVLQDPGHGFGREAQRCAMKETFTTALDRDGNAIAGVTKAFRIHFER